MPEQTEAGQQQQQPLQDIGPLLVSVVAAAAAGALAVLARKALSGGGDSQSASNDATGESKSDKAGTSFDDVDKVADDLQGLVEQLRSEAGGGRDSQRLTEIMDAIGEYADQAADAFNAGDAGEGEDGEASGRRVTDELMNRISELTSAEKEKAGSGSSSKSKQKAR